MAYSKLITASGQVKVGYSKLKGFLVSSTTSGTLTFYDGTSASDPKVIDTITPAAGSSPFFPADGMDFKNGIYIAVANTISVTVFYD